MVLRLTALLSSILIATASSSRYLVYKAAPRDEKGIAALNALSRLDHAIEIDFWKEAHRLGDHADIMITAKYRDFLEKRLLEYNISFNLSIPDVEKLIMRNERKPSIPYFSPINGKRLNDDPVLDAPTGGGQDLIGNLKRAKYPFGDYAPYAEMIRYLRAVEFYYPTITKIVRLGTTHEGRPIEGLKIGSPIHETAKPAVFIDGNIHAREWASSHTALFIINEVAPPFGDLVANYGVDPEVTRQVRLWRKNRSPEQCTKSLWGGERCCGGVDLNRNFDFHWAETGSSTEPCSNIYSGSGAFSEPETRAVEDFFRSKEMRGRVGAYLTLHTYGQLFIHPFSHATNAYPQDIEKLRFTAMKATSRLALKYGTRYQVGTGAEILSPASGGSDDWAKDQMKVKYVYLMELRPEDQYASVSNGFILSKRELIPTGVETFEAVKEVVNSMLNDKGNSDSMTAAERQKAIYREQQLRARANRHRTSTRSPTTTTSLLSTTPSTTTVHTTVPTTTPTTTARSTTTTALPLTTSVSSTTAPTTTSGLSTSSTSTASTVTNSTTVLPSTVTSTPTTTSTSTLSSATITATSPPTSSTTVPLSSATVTTTTPLPPSTALATTVASTTVTTALPSPATAILSSTTTVTPTSHPKSSTGATVTSTELATTTATGVSRTTSSSATSTLSSLAAESSSRPVPTRRRPWLTYKPLLQRTSTTPSTSSTTPSSTTTTSATTTTTTSKPGESRTQLGIGSSTVVWPTPASAFFDEWWNTKRHTKRPPAAPPVFSTIFTSHPELRSSLTDSTYLRTHNRVSTLHIDRTPPKVVVPDANSSRVKPPHSTPYDAQCKDMRLSCAFWLENAAGVCEEQSVFMQVQCALTCKFCTNIRPDSFADQIEDFRTMRQ